MYHKHQKHDLVLDTMGDWQPVQILVSDVSDRRRYLLLDLRKSDTGLYTCRAVSETGETARGAALVVETPTNTAVVFHRTPEPSTFPGSPSKPTVSEITDSSVLLSWRPSSTQGASPVNAYTVEYFSHDTGEVRHHHQISLCLPHEDGQAEFTITRYTRV